MNISTAVVPVFQMIFSLSQLCLCPKLNSWLWHVLGVLIYHFDNYVADSDFLSIVLTRLLTLIKQANLEHKLIKEPE